MYTIADIFADPHYAAREAIPAVEHATLGPVRVPGVVSRLVATPGAVRHLGPTTTPSSAVGSATPPPSSPAGGRRAWSNSLQSGPAVTDRAGGAGGVQKYRTKGCW